MRVKLMPCSGPHPVEPLAALAGRLRQHACRLTGPRQAILDLLRHQTHPLSNREVLAQLPVGHCNLATIYRAMRLLEGLGIVQRFDFGDGVARFELVREGTRGHHHHLICVRCAQVVELEDCFPPEFEARIAERNGYKQVRHKLEFFGVCPQCQ